MADLTDKIVTIRKREYPKNIHKSKFNNLYNLFFYKTKKTIIKYNI